MAEQSEAEKLFWEREHLRAGIAQANNRIVQIEQRLQVIANTKPVEDDKVEDAEAEQSTPKL